MYFVAVIAMMMRRRNSEGEVGRTIIANRQQNNWEIQKSKRQLVGSNCLPEMDKNASRAGFVTIIHGPEDLRKLRKFC